MLSWIVQVYVLNRQTGYTVGGSMCEMPEDSTELTEDERIGLKAIADDVMKKIQRHLEEKHGVKASGVSDILCPYCGHDFSSGPHRCPFFAGPEPVSHT